MRDNRVWLPIAALFAAGLLVGCGGGGGGSDSPDDGMQMPDPAIAQLALVKSAATTAATATAAVAGETVDQAAVNAATAAVNGLASAITAASDVPEAELAGYSSQVTANRATITAAQARVNAQQSAADKAAMDKMAAAGKALHGALGTNPLSNLDAATLSATGLLISTTDAGTDDDVTLKAGESAGTLGSWSGKHYAHMDARTKVSNAAVVYSDQGAPTTPKFSAWIGENLGGRSYAADDRRLTVGTTANTHVMAARFPTVGTTTYTPDAVGGDEVSFQGTYNGASGTYTCTGIGTTPCTVTHGGTAGFTLAGAWTFTHAADATVSVDDPNYLYFGWWLTKDKDDMATSASAFFGTVGTAPTALTGVESINGSATYSGHAAGKFAINNPLGGSDAGHFTADATLNAKFGGTGAGVTGVIDNFMANDKSVPWSVALNNNTLATDALDAAGADNFDNAGAITSTDNLVTATPNVDDSLTTVWSIDGNAAPASGTWSGQMYDLAQGDDDDGSDVPTTILGKFQSMFGSTHTMVGAFGASKDE